MPVLRWLSRFVGSTLAWLVNGTLSLGLFLLSAYLFAERDADAMVPAYVLRGVAAAWLFGATWHYFMHGVLQRPKSRAAQRAARGEKVGTKEGLLSTLGCMASLGAIAATGLFVGRYADWAFAGLTGGDPAHPARQALQRAADGASEVAADPAPYLASAVVAVAVLQVLRAVGARGAREPKRPSRAGEQEGTRRRSRERRRQGGAAQTPSTSRRVSNTGRTLTEPLLGTLRRDDQSGGWQLLNPRPGSGDLFIKADGEPREAQLLAAHAIVQRSFEVLLRASDAAAPAAKADGIGLPRFTMVTGVVHDTAGAHPRVTVRLRAEGGRVYEVASTDGMQTFKA